MTRLFSLLAISGCLFAQPRQFPIVSLTVEGNKSFTAEQILAVTGLRVGQPVEQQAFEAARDKLTASGFFESVGYQYKPSQDKAGFTASFTVVEVQQVYPVAFDRLTKPVDELKKVLQKADPLFGDKVPGTSQVLNRYAKILEGVVGDKVVGRLSTDSPGQLHIVFQPEKLPPSIAEVKFLKNDVLPATTLQNAIAGSAVGSVWEETRFRQILDANIRPLYEARGRIRVSFPKVTVEPVQDVDGLRAIVEVKEGEPYTLGDIATKTNAASARELLRAADLKSGDIANFDDINKSVERMKGYVRRNGFLKATATVDRKIDDAKKVVNLVVTIEQGKRFNFSKLNIVGLDILSEPEIRKAWAMKAGTPFNPDYPDAFLNRMRDEGVFENLGKTRSELKTDDEAGTVEVTLHFAAEKPDASDKTEDGYGSPRRRRR